MADGYIEFSTSLDNSELEEQLNAAKKRINELKKSIATKTEKRNAVAEDMQKAAEEIERTAERIEKLKARIAELEKSDDPLDAGRLKANVEALERAENQLDKQLDSAVKLGEEFYKLDNAVNRYSKELKETEDEYALLGQQAQKQAGESQGAFTKASETMREKMGGAATNIGNAFGNMIKKLALFALAASALNAIKNELMSVISQNAEFTASVENMKAVLGGFIDAFAAAILPALISVVNTIAAVFERIGGFIDSIFGSNILGAIAGRKNAVADANNMADAQNKQAKAAKNLGKAQKEANRQLMSFDELNVLAEESADGAADAMDDYAGAVGGGGLAGDFSDIGMLGGLLDWLDEILNRIMNDVDGPFARIREGLLLIKQGWDELIQGLMTGDWGLVWAGIRDIFIGILYVIEGAISAFLDWLNEITGGRFNDIFEGVKSILHGVVEFVEGILTGDIDLAIQGLHDIIDGFFQFLSGLIDANFDWTKMLVDNLFGSLKDVVNGFFDWLKETFPGLADFFENVRIVIIGIIEVIEGVVDGALVFIAGVLENACSSAAQQIGGLLDVITGLLTGNIDLIVRGLKGIVNGFISVVEGTINSVLGGLTWVLNGIIDAANMLPEVYIPYASQPWVSLPRLASGAIIPPNREFMAVLGDQTSGTNIETPEALMRQVVREEAGGTNAQMLMLLQQILSAIQSGHTLECDGYMLARVVNEQNTMSSRIYGAV